MVTRIRELLEARQLSPTQFADFIGVGRPVISHILSERNKPSLEVVQKVISAFPEVSLPWLLSGLGSMLATPPPVTTPVASSPPLPTAVLTPAIAQAAPILAIPTVQQVPPPLSRPLPPKFRPAAPASSRPLPTVAAIPTAEPAPMPALVTAPVVPAPPAPPAQPAAPTELSPAPSALPLASPIISAPAIPILLPPAAPSATAAEENAVASIASPSELLPTEPAINSAALSFLGEPGKAIRRIVIFYRDGSFSDYVPEG